MANINPLLGSAFSEIHPTASIQNSSSSIFNVLLILTAFSSFFFKMRAWRKITERLQKYKKITQVSDSTSGRYVYQPPDFLSNLVWELSDKTEVKVVVKLPNGETLVMIL